MLKVTFRPHVKEASPDQQVPGGWRAQLFLLLGFFAQLCDFAWVLPWTLLHSALMFLWLLDNFETSPVTCPLVWHVFGYCRVKKELSCCGEECVILHSLVLALELLRV